MADGGGMTSRRSTDKATAYPPLIEAQKMIMQALRGVDKHDPESIETMKSTILVALPDEELLWKAQRDILSKIQCELDNLSIHNVDEIIKKIEAIVSPLKAPKAVDFKLPDNPGSLRIRPAAHQVDQFYLAKYSEALQRMMNLPDDDPRSFINQANVHCVYCTDGSYCLKKKKTSGGSCHLPGLPNSDFSQIHSSWLFFPFHRAYLYFFERILGKLIDDPNFAIPYWNWDHPDGMVIPSWFNDKNSPFYDPLRNPTHLPPTAVDLDFPSLSPEERITNNLRIMYRQMVDQATKPERFFGDPYLRHHAAGSIESVPHNPVHNWTGTYAGEDMGLFYSAGRDPIFYSHHANVDRTWSIWKSLSPNNVDIDDDAFLNSYFYLYDENCQLVKIYVKDVLDTKKLGYDYQPMDLPWLNLSKQIRHPRSIAVDAHKEVTSFPQSLAVYPFRYNFPRPGKSRSEEDEEEILIVELEVDMSVYSKFDVLLYGYDNVLDSHITITIGSFVNVPHKRELQGTTTKTTFKLGLTNVIQELGADDDESIGIKFVPVTGTDLMVIHDVRIEFMS